MLRYSGAVESTALQLSMTRVFDANNITVLQRVSLSSASDSGNGSFAASLSSIKSADCRVIVSALDSSTLPAALLAARNVSLIGFNSSYTWVFNEIMVLPLWMHNEGIARSDAFDASVLVGSFLLKTHESLGTPERLQQVSDLLRAKYGFSSLPPLSQVLYDAVRVSARGVASALSPGATETEAEQADVFNGIKNSRFVGLTGAVAFDGRNRADVIIDVLNFQQSAGNVVVGHWSPSSGFNLDTNAIFSDGTNQAPPDRYVFPRATMEFSSPGAVAATVFAILLAVVYISSAVVLWMRQDIKAVRTSSPVFLATICFGLSLAAVSVLFWFGDPSVHTCRGRLWFAFLGCSIAYCSVLAKNWRSVSCTCFSNTFLLPPTSDYGICSTSRQ
jgi:hypothetical protein